MLETADLRGRQSSGPFPRDRAVPAKTSDPRDLEPESFAGLLQSACLNPFVGLSEASSERQRRYCKLLQF